MNFQRLLPANVSLLAGDSVYFSGTILDENRIFMLAGLTGAIGGGKSTALAAFAACNARICDADRMCHELYGEAAVVARLKNHWGENCLTDGLPDRQKIARIVFRNQQELDFLTGVLYPDLEKKMVAVRAEAAQPGSPVVVVEIPLLFECGWEKYCDVTVALWTGTALRHERLTGRGMTPEEVARREAKQWSEDRKLEAADFALINYGTRQDLEKQCKILMDIWKDQTK